MFLKSSFLAVAFISFGVFAKENDASQQFSWSKVRCTWSCSFKACENVRILRHCAKNCAPENMTHCMSVAKTAFGEEILKSVLKMPMKQPDVAPAPEQKKDVKTDIKPEVKVESATVQSPVDAEKKTQPPKKAQAPKPPQDPFKEMPESMPGEDAMDAQLKEIIPEMQDAA